MSIFALCRGGRIKAVEFLGDLDDRVRKRYEVHMDVYAKTQRLKGKYGHQMDPEKPPGIAARGLYAFKDNQSKTRILAFKSKVGWVLTHGFKDKKEDEFPPTEILRADEDRKWFKQYEDAAVAAQEKTQVANREGKK